MQAASYIAAALTKEVGSQVSRPSRAAGDADSDEENMPDLPPGVRSNSSMCWVVVNWVGIVRKLLNENKMKWKKYLLFQVSLEQMDNSVWRRATVYPLEISATDNLCFFSLDVDVFLSPMVNFLSS